MTDLDARIRTELSEYYEYAAMLGSGVEPVEALRAVLDECNRMERHAEDDWLPYVVSVELADTADTIREIIARALGVQNG